jgi:hypothetical protein
MNNKGEWNPDIKATVYPSYIDMAKVKENSKADNDNVKTKRVGPSKKQNLLVTPVQKLAQAMKSRSK